MMRSILLPSWLVSIVQQMTYYYVILLHCVCLTLLLILFGCQLITFLFLLCACFAMQSIHFLSYIRRFVCPACLIVYYLILNLNKDFILVSYLVKIIFMCFKLYLLQLLQFLLIFYMHLLWNHYLMLIFNCLLLFIFIFGCFFRSNQITDLNAFLPIKFFIVKIISLLLYFVIPIQTHLILSLNLLSIQNFLFQTLKQMLS